MAAKRALVVFYSRTGTTAKVARKIAAALQCDMEEIIDTKSRAGAWGWLGGGRDASRRKETVIRQIDKAPAGYDVVIIGTPVWAWTMTPAIRTYLAQNKESFKEVAFFCTMGGSGNVRTLTKMEELCGKKPTATLALKTKEVAADACEDRVKGFVAAILPGN